MRGSQTHETIWKAASGVLFFASVAPLLVGISFQFPPDQTEPGLVGESFLAISSNAAPILLWAVILGLSAEFVRRRYGNPWAWRTVEGLLDDLRDHLIADDYLNEDRHFHRVTLFRYEKFKLRPAITRIWSRSEKLRAPCKGWLVQVARSSHTTQNSKRIFCAPDKAGLAEGIAGLTWSRISTVDARGLVAPQLDDADSIKQYAEDTCISEEFVEGKLRAEEDLPLCMMGIPIVKGRIPWGVIVVDSVHNDGVEKYGDMDQTTILAHTVIIELSAEL